MNVPMTTITIDQNTAVLLRSLQIRAEAQGMTLESLLQKLAASDNGQPEPNSFYETATAEEWVKAFAEWANSHDPSIPALTLQDVSRESLYEDRY